MTRLDPLLEQIDRTLAECDARHLPPLPSDTAAAAIDLIEQHADAPLLPWQRQVVCGLYADRPDVVRQAEHVLAEFRRGIVSVEEARAAAAAYLNGWPARPTGAPKKPWWRRRWSR